MSDKEHVSLLVYYNYQVGDKVFIICGDKRVEKFRILDRRWSADGEGVKKYYRVVEDRIKDPAANNMSGTEMPEEILFASEKDAFTALVPRVNHELRYDAERLAKYMKDIVKSYDDSKITTGRSAVLLGELKAAATTILRLCDEH